MSALRNLVPACAAGYVCLLPSLKAAARSKGYALGLHGSLTTDMDLIAVPWADDADSPEALVAALAACFDGYIQHDSPQPKPHGRMAWSIHFKIGGPYLDVSVMPRVTR